jgi:hypothetical protein
MLSLGGTVMVVPNVLPHFELIYPGSTNDN